MDVVCTQPWRTVVLSVYKTLFSRQLWASVWRWCSKSSNWTTTGQRTFALASIGQPYRKISVALVSVHWQVLRGMWICTCLLSNSSNCWLALLIVIHLSDIWRWIMPLNHAAVSGLDRHRHYSCRQRRATLGDRAFSVAAARAWNALPSSVRTSSTYLAFCRQLKTLLFKASFEDRTWLRYLFVAQR